VVLPANEAPGAPTAVSPVGDVSVDPAAAVLAASPAIDPEGDALTYEFEVFSDDALASRVFVANGIGAEAGVVSVGVTGLALDPARYWWRVRAADAELMGPWSTTAVFKTGDLDAEPDPDPDPDPDVAGAKTDEGCSTAPGQFSGAGVLAVMLGLLLLWRRS
jgi:MYXO-CTERM domain-containing protein